jgi:hypothetical protein
MVVAHLNDFARPLVLRPPCVRDHSRMERFGLCDTCRHQRLVRTGRGSLFTMCLKSKDDATLPKYPRVPVTACHGYESGEA